MDAWDAEAKGERDLALEDGRKACENDGSL